MKRAILLCALTCAGLSEPMALPKYAGSDKLVKPTGWRQWMFVGANYGMGYAPGENIDNPKPKPGTFHNIYLQPEAFEHFSRTGEFPEKTMLIMEVVKPGTHASINKRGIFQDQQVGIEVALKDSSRFPDKWAYFNFIGEGGKQLNEAPAFKKDACWKCHNAHGAKDNVFAQFYPVLREVRPELGEALKTVQSAH
jgi:hypothetical protein